MRTRLVAAAVAVLLLTAPAWAQRAGRARELADAIDRGHLGAVKALLENGLDPETPLDEGGGTVTPLIKAAEKGRVAIVRYLVSKGASVHGRATDGATALLRASPRGYEDVVELLLKAGADVKASDRSGYTALARALFSGQLGVADLLVAAGADVDATDANGFTPLVTASSVCSPEVVRFLVSKGAKIDRVTQLEQGGTTPLITAATVGEVECVRTLLELGANPHVTTPGGGTALAAARQAGKADVVELITAALAKVPRPATSRTTGR